MPSIEIAFGKDVTDVVLVDGDDTEYNIPDEFLLSKAAEDGALSVLQLDTGNKFIGESVGSEFRRAWDANLDTPTAVLDKANDHLELSGVAAIAGTAGNFWINGQNPILVCKNLTITAKMQVPVDDTGAIANRDIRQSFFIKQDKDELQPDSDNNFIEARIDVDETGLILALYKEVNGVNTLLDSGFDYTMDGTRGIGDLEGNIWRLVPNGKPGTSGATLSVFLKQSDTLANAESADENELDGSPYDISDLAFYVGFSSLRIYSQNTTYFGAFGGGNEGIVDEIDFSYPNLGIKSFTQDEADVELCGVEIWDGDPASGGVQVFDEDHPFSNDPYIQNGLMRLHLDEGVNFGFNIQVWDGAAWNRVYDRYYLFQTTSSLDITNPRLKKIVSWSPEKTVLDVRLHNSSDEDNDFFVDIRVTLLRGANYVEYIILESYPSENIRVIYLNNAATYRFGYVGDDGFGDDDLNLDANNTDLDDNFLMGFDDAQETVLASISSNQKPTAGNQRFRVLDGGDLIIDDYLNTELDTLRNVITLTNFAEIAELFEEAEDATLSGGATVEADGAASGGEAVLLNAQNEFVRYAFAAGTDLPAGAYIAGIRIRDTNQVADDVFLRAFNVTDTENRGQLNFDTVTTVTADYLFYTVIFFITDTDEGDTDTIYIQVLKGTADANEIFVDYFVLPYFGDGQIGPQVEAHNTIRSVTKNAKNVRK